jgi:hypothetical protein
VAPGGADALCFTVYAAMDQWFGACFARQARQMYGEQGQAGDAASAIQSYISTDIRSVVEILVT